MRIRTCLLPAMAIIQLSAQNDLPAQLARTQGVSMEQLVNLQKHLSTATMPVASKSYYEALVAYTLVTRTQDKGSKEAEALLDEALRLLAPHQTPEHLALMGGCVSLKLACSPPSSMTLSSKAKGLFEAALQQHPNHPRALLFQGVHVLYTPALFGGGAKKALPILEAAAKAAAQEARPADPWAPRWGRVESLGWLALAQVSAGQSADAEGTLAKAKAMDPNHAFVLQVQRQITAAKQKG